MLSIVLAESALELVPREIQKSPAVVSDSRRRGAAPGEILLDRSYHHSAMLRLEDAEKRGRPDLVHVTLLSVTGAPLYLDGGVALYVHTCSDKVVEISPKTRIPKNYMRFRGLMEGALRDEPREGLVRAYSSSLRQLLRSVLAPGLVVGLSVQGRPATFEEVAEEVAAARQPCVLIGGFPRGHFTGATLGLTDKLERIDPRPLEAHVVASRLVYEVEKLQRANR